MWDGSDEAPLGYNYFFDMGRIQEKVKQDILLANGKIFKWGSPSIQMKTVNCFSWWLGNFKACTKHTQDLHCSS